jgi:hypothetical protein
VHLTAEEISHLDDEAFKMFTEGSAVDDDEFDVDDSEQPKLDGSRLSVRGLVYYIVDYTCI